MIPIRANTAMPITVLGGIRQLSTDHPLIDTDCPVCDNPIGTEPMTLVLVGWADDRKEFGRWGTGVAVAVHAACTVEPTDGSTYEPPTAKPDEQPQAERDSCIHCGRDFSLPYVTRQTGTNRCEDCTATCGFPACGHPDHQRTDCPELLQAERDADVRAVAVLLAARADGASMAECKHAFDELRDRFAERIAALNAGEGGAAR